jgi:fatty acid kinase/fatty acid kinase fatty acid binding subunit
MSDAHRIALAAARGAAAAVEASRGRLNDLNVYPVPDGDTGSNLADTARELAAGLEASSPDGAAAVAVAAKRAVLMGASGNSGAILSQIVGGFVDVVGSASGLDAATLARALRSASDAAYRPVQLPIEGTMLTVIRVMAETAEAHPDDDLNALIDRVLDAAADCVTRTQTMLAVLREAGVVDAGAAGLVEFCRGAVAGARGEQIHAPIESIVRPLSMEAVHQEESRFRYCTSFLVEGDEIERERLERQLRQLGDCLLVVGEAPMCRVHLHTDDPGAALSRAVAMGAIDRVAIANMHEQTRQREERLSAGPTLVAIPGGRADADATLTAENTAIVLDSTADVPHPEREHENWRMVPLIVRFGDEQFDDWAGIEPEELYRRLRAGGPHPRTAAPAPGAYLRMFEQLSDYAHIVVLPVSSKVSGSLQAAQIAADDPASSGRVTVIDGRSVSIGTWMLAEGVQRLLEEGTTLDELTAWVESARDRLRIVIYVPTLEYLRRGGRISRAREISGNALGVRPILTLHDGELGLYRRVRGGRRRALHAFERFLTEHAPEGRPARVGIAHGADPAGAESLVKMVRAVRPDATIERVCEIGAVVGTHGGPGTLGMMVLAEP